MWLQSDAGNSRVSPRRVSPRAQPIKGAQVAGRYSALAGRGFSSFSYSVDGQSDPYEASERARRASSVRAPKQTLSPRLSARPPFKHTALPPAPKQAGTFQRFRYSIDPFEPRDEHKQPLSGRASGAMSGLFIAGGNARDEKRSLRRRMPELREQLKRSLRSDWPSFAGLQLDERGVIIVLFDAAQLDSERRVNLHEYMNRLLATHPAASEFILQKDPTRWGTPDELADDAEALAATLPDEPIRSRRLVYALRPPWVANDLLLAHRLAGQRPSQLSQLTATAPLGAQRARIRS